METEIESALLNIVLILVNIVKQGEIHAKFEWCLRILIETKQKWISKNQPGIPTAFKVIQSLNKINDENVLVEFICDLENEPQTEASPFDTEIEAELAETIEILVQLQREGKLEMEFEKYFDSLVDVKRVWICQKKSGVPPQFKVIKSLATSEDYDVLHEHLSELGANLSRKNINSDNSVHTENDQPQDDFGNTTNEDELYFYQSRFGDNISELNPNDQPKQIVTQVAVPDDEFTQKIKEVIEIVKTIIFSQNVDTGVQMERYLDVISILAVRELEWKKTQAGNNTYVHSKYLLPPDHSIILLLNKDNNMEGLHQLIRCLIEEAEIEKPTKKIRKYIVEATEASEVSTNVASAVGSTLHGALSILHILAPTASAFKSLVDNLNIALLHPVLSSTATWVGVPGVFIAGICIWNAYCCYKGTKTRQQAIKSSMDNIGPMAVSIGVGIVAATLFASGGPPVWTSALIFGGIGLFAHLISVPIFKRFSTWLFYELPEKKALKRAYLTLNVSPDAKDEEIRHAYRRESRKYHPDSITPKGATEEEIKEARDKLQEVQQAFEFIIAKRLEKMDKDDNEGLFSRIRRFFSAPARPQNEKPQPISL